MPNIDLSILNQRQTPAFYADVFANRPAAGFVGRIFVSTNTFAFYRDNGTGWDLIGGPGTGTVTGTGANGQVTFWNGASTITGSNDLFWDAANGHFGVNTNVPGTALDVHHDQPTVAIINQTVATNDVRIGFQNNGVGLWRIGAFYNAGANDFGIYDAVAAIQPVTVKKTTGQVLIGTSTVGAGKLVVASATGDNGVQIVGATSPSLRIDNAEVGATKRIGIGLATAVNNFIQNSQNLDMCIFNSSTTAAGNMLFGIYDTGLSNTQEAARISAARNFLIGTIVDAGQKLQVSGTALITGAATFSSNVTANGNNLTIQPTTTTTYALSVMQNAGGYLRVGKDTSTGALYGDPYSGLVVSSGAYPLLFGTNDIERMRINSDASFGFNSTGLGSRTYFFKGVSGRPLVIEASESTGVHSIYLRPNTTVSNLISSNYISGGVYLPLSLSGRENNADLCLSISGNTLIGTTTDAGQKLQVSGTARITGITSIGSAANNDGLSTNTKLRVCGDGSTNAGASMGSCFAAAGVGSGYDTGISVNMGTSGGTMLLMASINTSTGTSTNSAIYIVRFYFDGNNLPTTTYLGGSSDFVTFSVSGSNTLILTASNAGNRSYSWFINKLEN